MKKESLVKVKPAVFARNYQHYLEEAAKLPSTEFITFRSAQMWTSARNTLEHHTTIPIYFSVIGDTNQVKFIAHLVNVHLQPDYADPETQKWLSFSLPSTKSEGLWEKFGMEVKTLYIIRKCYQLEQSFPITRLVKLSDDKPISSNYRYSYSMVHQQGTEPETSVVYPDEIEEPSQYLEGATRQVTVTSYERSRAAREECLQHYGYDCAACGFNFERTYGPMGKTFIHVHHLISISEIDSAYEVDPLNDLIPLCPNCHAMAHKESPPISIDRLKDILRANRQSL